VGYEDKGIFRILMEILIFLNGFWKFVLLLERNGAADFGFLRTYWLALSGN